MNKMNGTVKDSGKKKGFFALLWESIAKSNDGCGPGCGCHAEVEKKPEGKTTAQPNKGK